MTARAQPCWSTDSVRRGPESGSACRSRTHVPGDCGAGTDILYGGALGRRIAAFVRESGGFLTSEDFAAHTVDWVQPISVPFRGYRLWELPPNSQGVAALEMLRLLDGTDLKAMGHNSPAYLHHLIEAKKLAYADIEHYVGDPAAMTVPVDRFLSDAYIRNGGCSST